MSEWPRPEAIEAHQHNLIDQLVYAVGLVDFKEKQQEWFCYVCCYRDPLGTKLHADGCRYMELSRQLDSELDALRQQLAEAEELHRMQLAAVTAAALGNTRSTAGERIGRENPYWTAAYHDVCNAVDREIEHREKLVEAEAEKRPLLARVSQLELVVAACVDAERGVEVSDFLLTFAPVRAIQDQRAALREAETVLRGAAKVGVDCSTWNVSSKEDSSRR